MVFASGSCFSQLPVCRARTYQKSCDTEESTPHHSKSGSDDEPTISTHNTAVNAASRAQHSMTGSKPKKRHATTIAANTAFLCNKSNGPGLNSVYAVWSHNGIRMANTGEPPCYRE